MVEYLKFALTGLAALSLIGLAFFLVEITIPGSAFYILISFIIVAVSAIVGMFINEVKNG